MRGLRTLSGVAERKGLGRSAGASQRAGRPTNASSERPRRGAARTRRVAVIVDEAVKIKNPTSEITQAFFELSPYFVRRVIMTGTPEGVSPIQPGDRIEVEPGVYQQTIVVDRDGVTLAGVPFPHLVYHLVLTYSNVEAVRVCFSESFESLAEGLESCLWQIGGVPQWHRTDNLSAAVRDLDREGRHEFTQNYRALLAHYGMQPAANTAGLAHQNGDVEQSHFRFKQAVDQALRVRGSRDFADRGAYERFLSELVRQRNLTRSQRFAIERTALRALPAAPLDFTRELTVRVSRFSLVRVLLNHYSVPSRLIGHKLLVRLYDDRLDCFLGSTHILTLERGRPKANGKHGHVIDYRHVIHALRRKPMALLNLVYRDQLFPRRAYARAFDALLSGAGEKHACRTLVGLLALAHERTCEAELALAVEADLDAGALPDLKALTERFRPKNAAVPVVVVTLPSLAIYDEIAAARGEAA